MLCHALQEILVDAFHPMRADKWTGIDSEIYDHIDQRPTTLPLEKLRELIDYYIHEDYDYLLLTKHEPPQWAYSQEFLREVG